MGRLLRADVQAAPLAAEPQGRGEMGPDVARRERLEALRRELDGLPKLGAQRATTTRVEAVRDAAVTATDEARGRLTEARELLEQASEANALQRRWRGLPKPDEQVSIVEELQRTLTERESAEASAIRTVGEAQAILARTEELTGRLLAELDDALAWFAERFDGDPRERIRVAAQSHRQLVAEERDLSERVRADGVNRDNLRNAAWRWLTALQGWGLDVNAARAAAEEMLDELVAARERVATLVAGRDPGALRSESDELNGDIRRANAELAEIAELMETVETTSSVRPP